MGCGFTGKEAKALVWLGTWAIAVTVRSQNQRGIGMELEIKRVCDANGEVTFIIVNTKTGEIVCRVSTMKDAEESLEGLKKIFGG